MLLTRFFRGIFSPISLDYVVCGCPLEHHYLKSEETVCELWDVSSLYPYVAKVENYFTEKFFVLTQRSIRKRIKITKNDILLDEKPFHGFAQVRVIPPRDLELPYLGMLVNLKVDNESIENAENCEEFENSESFSKTTFYNDSEEMINFDQSTFHNNSESIKASFETTTTTKQIKTNLFKEVYDDKTRKSFLCLMCDYQSIRKDHLKSHLKLVHETDGEKYDCDECDYQAIYPGNLKRHINSVHNMKTFPCEHCDFQAKENRTLKKHTEKRHG